MTDRPKTDDPKDAAGASAETPKPKVTRARTTVDKPPAKASAKTDKSAAAVTGVAAKAQKAEIDMKLSLPDDALPTSPEAIPENVTITNGGIRTAQATNVSVTQGGITDVEATHVDVRQGGIVRADAKDVAVTMGGIVLARADRVTTEMSGVGLSIAGDASVTQSFVRTMFAREVRVDQGGVWNLAAGKVTFEGRGFAGVVLAGKVDGEVKALLDWRGALAVGGIAVLVLAVLRRR